ncbi:MAG: hypothetical protein QOF58_6395 [Pseudonocardiales bacterium]|nr:hypothetical protein [Pseudonocardiales bacterium]
MQTSAAKTAGAEFDALIGEFAAPARPGAYEMSENGVFLGIADDSEDEVARGRLSG